MTDRLGRRRLVTLEAARVEADLPGLADLSSWLDSWAGIGRVALRDAEARGLFDSPGLTAHHFVKGVKGAGPHARGEAWFRPAEADANSPLFWGKRLRLGRRP